jgi:hypothetical protein
VWGCEPGGGDKRDFDYKQSRQARQQCFDGGFVAVEIMGLAPMDLGSSCDIKGDVGG